VRLDFLIPNPTLTVCGLTRLAGRTTKSFGTASASDNVERVMKKALVLILVGLSVAGCTQTEKGAGIGAGTGAIIGGLATGNVRGAAVGAAIGGVSGAVIGSVSEQPGQCYYRDRYGNRYVDRCPR
jgi:ABC-type uncharacterized transport system permease subunit